MTSWRFGGLPLFKFEEGSEAWSWKEKDARYHIGARMDSSDAEIFDEIHDRVSLHIYFEKQRKTPASLPPYQVPGSSSGPFDLKSR